MSDSPKILVVDDDRDSRAAMAQLATQWGYRVASAPDGQEALALARGSRPDVILTDLIMPTMGGMNLLQSLKEAQPDCVVVIVTGQGSIDTAVEAIRCGAYDYIEKPLEPPRLRLLLQRALEKKRTEHEVESLRQVVRRLGPGGKFVGQSEAMRRVLELVQKVAPSKASVIVTGQSGTGKEMVARAIHQLSPRRDKPFVAINCSAIPPSLMESEIFGAEKGAFTGADQRRLGQFELADEGTLFLDEIGELPHELQAKFLRVLEEERLRRLGGKGEVEVDVRVLCATNLDLKEEVRAGRFREDLFFRLNVFQIHLPPLRERAEDVPLLAAHFVAKFDRESGRRIQGIESRAMELLKAYSWPGNIRELRNALERAVILTDGAQIGPDHLPPEIAGAAVAAEAIRLPLGRPMAEMERAYILGTLAKNGGNRTRTAALLGISEKTLYNRLKEYREAEGNQGPRLDP